MKPIKHKRNNETPADTSGITEEQAIQLAQTTAKEEILSLSLNRAGMVEAMGKINAIALPLYHRTLGKDSKKRGEKFVPVRMLAEITGLSKSTVAEMLLALGKEPGQAPRKTGKDITEGEFVACFVGLDAKTLKAWFKTIPASYRKTLAKLAKVEKPVSVATAPAKVA